MDLLEQIDRHRDDLIGAVGIGLDQFGKRFRVQQFKDGTVAFADLDDIVRDRCRDAQDQGCTGELSFTLDLRQRVRFEVDFDDRIGIDAVDLAVGALADDFAAFDRDFTVGFLNVHHLGETGDVEDLIDLGIDVDDLQIGEILLQTQQDAQTGTGDVLQVLHVDDDIADILPFHCLVDLRFHRGCVV